MLLLIKEKRKLQRQYGILVLLLVLLLSVIFWDSAQVNDNLFYWLFLTGLTGFFLLVIFLLAYVLSTVERVGGIPNRYNFRFIRRVNVQVAVLLLAAVYFFFIRPERLAQDQVFHEQSFIGSVDSSGWQLDQDRLLQLDRNSDEYLRSELRGRKTVLYKYMAFDTATNPFDSVFVVEILFGWERGTDPVSYRKLYINDQDEVRDSTPVKSDLRIAWLRNKAKEEQKQVDSLFEAYTR